MPGTRFPGKRAVAAGASALVAAGAVAAVALGAEDPFAGDSASKVKVSCPAHVRKGTKVVDCEIVGSLPAGPRGPAGARGPKGATGSAGVTGSAGATGQTGATGPSGAKGDTGATGAKGDTGAPGAAGAPGMSGYEIVTQTFAAVFVPDSNTTRGLSAAQIVSCPAGKRAVGGGADLGTNAGQAGLQRQIVISSSEPTTAGDGWSAQLFNNSSFGATLDLEVRVVCVTVT